MGKRAEVMIKLGSQYYDVVGLKELEILHTQIFANNLEFGNNGIVVWEAEQLEPCRDVDVGMLALAVLSLLDMSRVCSVPRLDTNRA